MKIKPEIVPLTRVITWEDWERGRAARRAIVDEITGGRILRRKESDDPRKDAMLRQICHGERGTPYREF